MVWFVIVNWVESLGNGASVNDQQSSEVYLRLCST